MNNVATLVWIYWCVPITTALSRKNLSSSSPPIRQAPLQTKVQVHVPRQSARPKLSKTKARPKRPSRQAELEVRYQRIQLRPPDYHSDKDPIDVWVIHAVEASAPEATEPVEWFLLTTVNITSPEDAVQCLRWYCLRWRIEDFHRVLKSGCGVEQIAHETAERIRRAIAINLVIAWRIMLMTLLGRETPELPPEVLFSDIELQVLRAYAKKNGSNDPQRCATPFASSPASADTWAARTIPNPATN